LRRRFLSLLGGANRPPSCWLSIRSTCLKIYTVPLRTRGSSNFKPIDKTRRSQVHLYLMQFQDSAVFQSTLPVLRAYPERAWQLLHFNPQTKPTLSRVIQKMLGCFWHRRLTLPDKVSESIKAKKNVLIFRDFKNDFTHQLTTARERSLRTPHSKSHFTDVHDKNTHQIPRIRQQLFVR